MATRLTELRDPLMGRNPQLGQHCDKNSSPLPHHHTATSSHSAHQLQQDMPTFKFQPIA